MVSRTIRDPCFFAPHAIGALFRSYSTTADRVIIAQCRKASNAEWIPYGVPAHFSNSRRPLLGRGRVRWPVYASHVRQVIWRLPVNFRIGRVIQKARNLPGVSA